MPVPKTIKEASALLLAEWRRSPPGSKPIIWKCRGCGNSYQPFPLGEPRTECPHCGHQDSAEFILGIVAVERQCRAEHPEYYQEPEPLPESEPTAPDARPDALDDVIGNAGAVAQVRMALDAWTARQKATEKGRASPFPHLLFAGPGGCGKGMLARIIARAVGGKLHLHLGQTLSNPTKVAEALLALKRGDVLFIDEIHGLRRPAQEALYSAMEEGIVIPATRAGKPLSPPVRLPAFTVIGATTDEYLLLPSLRQRFKYVVALFRMTPGELAAAMAGRAARVGLAVDREALAMIGARAMGTPRLAIRLLDACCDLAAPQHEKDITAGLVAMACDILCLDTLGLGWVARQYLGFLAAAGGEPVRLNVLASKLDGLSKATVERNIESDLVWLGLIEKAASGRRITPAGKEHLAKEKP